MTGGSDGNDTFWPGYVDAISNLVLNLLFVVAILTIAVFLFALELGRRQVEGTQKLKGAEAGKTQQLESAAEAAKRKDLETQVKNLKRELETAKTAVIAANNAIQAGQSNQATTANALAPTAASAAKQKPAETIDRAVAANAPAPSVGDGTPPKVLNASERIQEPEKEIQKIQSRSGGIVIVFANDAIALTGTEASKARDALAPIKATGTARLEVIVPAGFSETRRLGFYRAMAVRNLLIEMGMANEKIEVGLTEVKSGGDSARVLVRPR